MAYSKKLGDRQVRRIKSNSFAQNDFTFLSPQPDLAGFNIGKEHIQMNTFDKV